MATTRSNSRTTPIDILIVGAGIAGTALAAFLLLAQLKQADLAFRITVIERTPSTQGHGQNIDIRGPGKKILKKLGIDSDVRAATTGEKGVRFLDSVGKILASFGVDESGEIETPTGEIEILRGRLAQILFKRCRTLSEHVEQAGGTGVEFIFGESVEEIQQQARSEQNPDMTDHESKVRVRLRKSKTWRTFDVVVGADGLQSRTRALAWGIEQNKSDGSLTPDSPERAVANEEELRHRNPFSNAVIEPTSSLPEAGFQGTNPGNIPAPVPSVKNSPANADPFLNPLGVYAAFYSIPASLFATLDCGSSMADLKAANANDHLDYNDDWRRWYHAPGRRSVMLRPSDDKSKLTVLMIVLDLKHRDPRLRAVATVRSDRNKTVAEQKKLMREYFEHVGWECARLADGMDAADDFYYDLVAQVKMDKWSKGRVCLLGDAAHCASPFSGMGTTLALAGAHNLAASLTNSLASPSRTRSSPEPNPSGFPSAVSAVDLTATFEEYESATRPIVSNAQKLPPGMPWLIHPETEWGVWVMRSIVGFICWSGIVTAIARLAGPGSKGPKDGGLLAWEIEEERF